MTSPAGSYEPAEDVRLDPHDFVDAGVAPRIEAVTSELHRATRHPKEQQSAWLLYRRDAEREELRVGQRAVRKL